MIEYARRYISSPEKHTEFNEKCLCGNKNIPIQFGATELPTGERLEDHHAICWECSRIYRLVERFDWQTLTFLHYWALYFDGMVKL